MMQYPKNQIVTTSAPCRIDFGGTLDISLLHYTLRHLKPCTFNVALDMRTRVTIRPYTKDQVKISSKGFTDASFSADNLPFDHPLGLMFAIASYYRITGAHIHIDSSSPPRSALGGSSTAAVALIAALSSVVDETITPHQIAQLAYQIESNVARVPCGIQDQLAAVSGGVNIWHFGASPAAPQFTQECLSPKMDHSDFQKHILIAYCGVPHESKDINGQWIKQFLQGTSRKQWQQIVHLTHTFTKALLNQDWSTVVSTMNDEVGIRLQMTPDVLDKTGKLLRQSAIDNQCAARFTGAGGGGCMWAIGEIANIDKLRDVWQTILNSHSDASLLQNKIADCGVIIEGDNK
ncbi:MAG: GHMP kinase [Candidatus Magnetoglobus multicellularis str. Araruama]|uniref:GHMP kinase n=1 Tax=Candidatus Magnetoglobus multicellularis str. Araruama TaxID=890399 RepID=A0A1V1PH67_9BACT|nr:MAG: GHMP kinase [Candidatus Magnetoglobus multicellularis str. Araruama]